MLLLGRLLLGRMLLSSSLGHQVQEVLARCLGGDRSLRLDSPVCLLWHSEANCLLLLFLLFVFGIARIRAIIGGTFARLFSDLLGNLRQRVFFQDCLCLGDVWVVPASSSPECSWAVPLCHVLASKATILAACWSSALALTSRDP